NDSSGDRVYLTGDMGRMMPDGLLIHLGRKDSMVKIRGYQVEIGEVEKTLMSHPNINDAVVLAQWREPGEAFLVGYYVSPRPSGLTVSELRTFLRRTIPDHMIPTALIRMESLPLTANGKIDRQRLPEPDHKRPGLSAAFVEARDEVEQRLVQVWVEVLGVDRVGIHDNFFDLGGNSIAATRVVSRIIQRFRLAIPLPALFQMPTVAEMATVIKENQAKKLPEKELEQILAALESMSDEEAQKHLGEIRVLGPKNE
ncbi:MAG TPA: phosphopantetheine-binding protein, partial [Candidatus Limnocylindria bacterium]|nr:phosphopantetheine-binding protein [Candidatus Limnocylindria bacterium]